MQIVLRAMNAREGTWHSPHTSRYFASRSNVELCRFYSFRTTNGYMYLD